MRLKREDRQALTPRVQTEQKRESEPSTPREALMLPWAA